MFHQFCLNFYFLKGYSLLFDCFVPLCFSSFFDSCLRVPFTVYCLSNASKAVHDEELLLCRVEFDRLTDFLRARTIEPDPPTSIVSREEKNEGIRIDGIGGSTSHQMAAESPTVKVRTKPAHTSILYCLQYKVTKKVCSWEPWKQSQIRGIPVLFIIPFPVSLGLGCVVVYVYLLQIIAVTLHI